MQTKKVLAVIVLVGASLIGGANLDFAQTIGSPVNSDGVASLSGSPYVKKSKRYNRNMYGRHYNMNQHSKGSH
jgi:hypothetical protein